MHLVALLIGFAAAFAPPTPLRAVRARGQPLYADAEMIKSAQNQVQDFKSSHGGHEPPELKALENAIALNMDTNDVGSRMYELLCTSYLDYDRDADDETKLVPSTTVGETLDKDLPGLKDVLTNLYAYGMRMIPSGFISVESCKRIVEERLAKRVGVTGEALDDWLDVPAPPGL